MITDTKTADLLAKALTVLEMVPANDPSPGYLAQLQAEHIAPLVEEIYEALED